jgi:56kDa selenium binding protein (SBP56)
MRFRFRKSVRHASVGLLSLGLVGTFTAATPVGNAAAESTSSVTASDGITYTATNHLLPEARHWGREWLLAWAGSADKTKPDFMAVIDATPTSRSYGKVVNTVTMGPGLANEAHHMQYVWHKGDRIYAGGLFSDTVFVFDSRALPALKLVGVAAPADTQCGTAPDAFQVMRDGTAYGTFLGSGSVPGPCTYTNGEVRVGNGASGSPGEVVRFDKNGKVLAEIPAATPEGEDPVQCGDEPKLEKATCANPHGIMVNEKRNIMVASDFVEGKDFGSPDSPLREDLSRQTVRVWDIHNRNNPKMLSVSKVPDGPRSVLESDPIWNESRVIMEPALPNKPQHKGAFVESMTGGAVFYTPDIAARHPKWREVLDDTTAYRKAGADKDLTGGGDNGSWLMVSPDDRFLFHAVMGYPKAYGKPLDKTRGMIYVLDIQKLLAAGNNTKCSIDKLAEVYSGGNERDCPAVVGVEMIRDTTDGGTHWGAIDNFARDAHGIYRETENVRRIASANYFIAGAFGGDGNHLVCMHNLAPNGKITRDLTFRDEYNHRPCVDFNRKSWPHGDYGDARPHGVMFAVSDRVVR